MQQVVQNASCLSRKPITAKDLVHISHSQGQPYKKTENIVECSAESPEMINAHVHVYKDDRPSIC